MSAQQPLTSERILEMFRKTERLLKKLGKKQEATDRQIKRTSREVGKLTSRIGKIVENMVKGNIVEKFQDLGYNDLDKCYENLKFANKKLGLRGEIDLILENGDIAILIEVKTTLETKDVRDHVERLEKYRRCIEVKNVGDKRRFIGVVAGAIVEGDAETVAHENGMYVIVQSGKAVEIITPPEGFVAKKW